MTTEVTVTEDAAKVLNAALVDAYGKFYMNMKSVLADITAIMPENKDILEQKYIEIAESISTKGKLIHYLAEMEKFYAMFSAYIAEDSNTKSSYDEAKEAGFEIIRKRDEFFVKTKQLSQEEQQELLNNAFSEKEHSMAQEHTKEKGSDTIDKKDKKEDSQEKMVLLVSANIIVDGEEAARVETFVKVDADTKEEDLEKAIENALKQKIEINVIEAEPMEGEEDE